MFTNMSGLLTYEEDRQAIGHQKCETIQRTRRMIEIERNRSEADLFDGMPSSSGGNKHWMYYLWLGLIALAVVKLCDEYLAYRCGVYGGVRCCGLVDLLLSGRIWWNTEGIEIAH